MQAAHAILTERLSLLIAAVILSVILSGFLRPKAPALALKRWMLSIVSRLNRAHRSAGTLVYRGIILLLFMGGAAWLCGVLLASADQYSPWLYLPQLVAMAYLIPAKHLRDEVSELAKAVQNDQMPRARGLADALARRAHEKLDAPGLLRVAIEYLAENWNDKIVAPIFWYILLGLPGLFLVRMVNLLDHLVGYRSREYVAFGWAAAKADDLMQFIPARLAGLLLSMAAMFIPKGQPMRSLRLIWRQSGDVSSPNSGWPLAAMAGALNISLCGPRRVKGAVIEDAWIGRGSARAHQSDIRRAIMLYAVSVLLLLLICTFVLANLSGTEFSAIKAW